MVADYKHKIGFSGTLLIEPKPQEPTKHQYDYDVATVFGFLQRYGLEKEFKVNVEVNHATLAGHSFQRKIALATSLVFLGSVDELALACYEIIRNGGFKIGGFNFDAKLRRQSLDPMDLFHVSLRPVKYFFCFKTV